MIKKLTASILCAILVVAALPQGCFALPSAGGGRSQRIEPSRLPSFTVRSAAELFKAISTAGIVNGLHPQELIGIAEDTPSFFSGTTDVLQATDSLPVSLELMGEPGSRRLRQAEGPSQEFGGGADRRTAGPSALNAARL